MNSTLKSINMKTIFHKEQNEKQERKTKTLQNTQYQKWNLNREFFAQNERAKQNQN